MAICASDFSSSTNGILILRNNFIVNNGDDVNSSESETVIVYDVKYSYITNNTFAANDSSSRSCIVIEAEHFDCEVDVFNNIIYDNDVATGKYQLHFLGDSTYDLTYQIAYNSIESLSWGYNAYTTEDWKHNNYDLDPVFTSSDPYYHLLSTSDCIDAGISPADSTWSSYVSDAYISYVDYDGDRRPKDGDGDSNADFDIGADEYVP